MGYGLVLPKFLWPLIKQSAAGTQAILRAQIAPVIAQRKLDKTPNVDVLQGLIDSGVGDEEIVTSIQAIMWAAVMNTSALLHHLLYDIFNPSAVHVLQKIQAEQDSLGGGDLSYEHLSQMPYLTACLKETLRLAASPCGACRGVHESFHDERYGTIPAGTIILISRWLLHVDEDYWKAPNEYNPERFLDPDNAPPPCAWFPFGGGKHECPGQYYAIFAAKIVIHQLLRGWKAEMSDPRPARLAEGNEIRSAPCRIFFSKLD